MAQALLGGTLVQRSHSTLHRQDRSRTQRCAVKLTAVLVTTAAAMAGSGTAHANLPIWPGSPPGGGFGPASVWRTDIRLAPVAPHSAGMVARLARQVTEQGNGIASFNLYRFGE